MDKTDESVYDEMITPKTAGKKLSEIDEMYEEAVSLFKNQRYVASKKGYLP